MRQAVLSTPFASLIGSFMLMVIMSNCVYFQEEDPTPPAYHLNKIAFKNLPGWKQENFKDVKKGFSQSCRVFQKKSPEETDPFLGPMKAWQTICSALEMLPDSPAALRKFMEAHFDVYQIITETTTKGLFTGYYEPELKGSLTQYGPYQYPLYKVPNDLILIPDLGLFHPELKGKKITGRIQNQRLIPYYTRADINARTIRKEEVIAYVDSDVDAFFLHIQGSGRIRLPNGNILRVGYANQNGHRYESIGKFLIREAGIPKSEMSMQRIRQWLKENPKKKKALLNRNPSYIFFQVLNDVENPLGSMGVEVTPKRTLAVDRRAYTLGAPMWVDTTPLDGENKPFQRLLFAQDTGGAIKGAIRGDVFFGPGKSAAEAAGKMQNEGALYVFLPKETAQEKSPHV